jgi:ubiquinone/menaquinone biosynthesis C-methylase UbiE
MDTNKDAVAIFDKLAEQYQDKFMDVNIYHDSLVLFCNELHTNGASVLDIACGPGNVTKYLLNKRPDLRILGIDLALNMLTLAMVNSPGAEFRLLDSRNISTLGSKYDGVVWCVPFVCRTYLKKKR